MSKIHKFHNISFFIFHFSELKIRGNMLGITRRLSDKTKAVIIPPPKKINA